MANNLDRLQAAGVVPRDAKLSNAEAAVVDGLSEEEVQTLISIRGRLQQQVDKEQEESAALSVPEVNPNFIV